MALHMAKDTSSFADALKFLKKNKLIVETDEKIKRVRTDIVGIDWLLGGGMPRGRVVEIYGAESAGKTTLAAEIIKPFQDRCAIYVDFEHSVDLHWFSKIGVQRDDEKKWLFMQPDYLEIGVDAVIKVIDTGQVGIVVFDSVAAMIPKAELEGDIADNSVALQARKIGQSLRKLVGALNRHNTTALFINQLRDKIGGFNPFNSGVTPGGKALKFYSSIRLEMKKGKGTDRVITLRKQKTCTGTPGSRVKFSIGDHGIDRVAHLKGMALLTIVANRSGSYFVGKRKLCRGEEEFDQKFESLKFRESMAKSIIRYLEHNPKEKWG